MTLIPEDFLYVTTKKFLRDRGWTVFAGEPPNGTPDDLIRLLIRKKGTSGRLHSLGSEKVDLISRKGFVFLLTEIKPTLEKGDIIKLNRIVTSRINDLKDALWERFKIPRDEVKQVLKSLAFSSGRLVTIEADFIYFRIAQNGSVVVQTGRSVTFEGL